MRPSHPSPEFSPLPCGPALRGVATPAAQIPPAGGNPVMWLLWTMMSTVALPFLLLSVYFGALADRHDCRKLIQIAQIMYMFVSATWAILFLTDTIEVWHACVLLVIHGVAGVFWTPAEILLIHDIVGSDDLPSAVRLNATSRQLGILFGPAVGGGLMLWLGAPAGLWVNALIYLPFTIWLAVVPYSGHTRAGAQARRAPRWRDALDALREVGASGRRR